ncbi:LysR substrate-binding domain-containing protein [Allokutzneria sp. A3M-2-11 16]|uniref:LysR substrate-binding domain-containing protein n=1 Tax=Allokutzneria sp. A3M-2-11 16 TaxID=2962043 RepID=UPI0020B67669|nr:LysR substrate-binding domain-containing protein [Allokutzneria sp. A3M-2-11 16]MCP3798124.1 LysR substrate-binding domain-containing protein [Allokutzneria sp. A3M-2-11 16]
MVDAARLRVLVEVAHAGSIAAAATRMAFTPSALSQQLSKLERELGARLLDRGPGGVKLTAAGRVLVEHGERVLGELRAADEAVRALLGEEPERLSIGAFPTAGQLLVPRALGEFRSRHPGVQLSLVDLEPPAGYGLVASRELDLLITHRYPGVALPKADGLQRLRLLDDPLLLAVPAAHALAEAERVAFADLAGQEWICGGPGIADLITLERLARRTGIDVKVAFETHNYEVTLALLRAGLGMALLPASVFARADTTRVVARELADVRPARRVYVVLRRRPSALVSEVVELLRTVSESVRWPSGRR